MRICLCGDKPQLHSLMFYPHILPVGGANHVLPVMAVLRSRHCFRCHPTIGACSCRAGFTGASCDSICPLSYYGENCAKKCDCALGTGSQCDPVNGTCFCAPGYRGPR